MKRIILLIILLFVFFNFSNIALHAKNEEDLVLNNVNDLLDSYLIGENYLLIYQDNCKYFIDDEELNIEGKYLNHCFNDNHLYLLVNKNKQTVLLDITENKINKEAIIDSTYNINKMLFSKKNLYLFGNNKTEALVVLLNSDLKETKKYTFGGNNHLTINDAVIVNDEWILSCNKDAHSLDNLYENIGNFGQTKACLIKLNEKFQQKDIIYLNKENNFETIIYFNYLNDKLYFVLEGDEEFYYYTLDDKFITLKLEETTQKYDDILLGYNGEFLKVDKSDEFILYDKDVVYRFPEKVLEYKIQNGLLEIFYLKNNNLYKTTFDEYHINQLETFMMGFNYGTLSTTKDINDTNGISIKSYFGPVSVYIDTMTSNLSPGSYDVDLLIKRPNFETIKISNKLDVEYYLNVYQNGVFRTGLVLNFLGSAKLNGELITNGYYVNNPGKYTLITTNEKKEQITTNFTVVDDYYIKNDGVINCDYEVPVNSSTYLDFIIPAEGEVQKVIVNNEEAKFVQTGNTLKILYTANDQYEIITNVLNNIVIDGVQYDVNQEFKVKTLKHLPYIDVVEQETDTFGLNVSIDDQDQTIKYLKICQNGNNEFVDYNYLKKGVFALPNYNKDNNVIDLYLCYDIGDNNIIEQKILTIDGKYKDANLLEIDPSFNNNELTQIRISLIDNNVKKLNYLSFGTNDVTGSYVKTYNYKNLIISGVITLAIIVGLVVYKIIRKKNTPSI